MLAQEGLGSGAPLDPAGACPGEEVREECLAARPYC